jgi:acyl-CoA thioester hydrolase
MARVKLVEQETYEFHHPWQVGPRDINYGGHLGHDSLVSLVWTARALVFHSSGLSEADLGDGRTSLLMGDLVVNYKGEAFMFDDLVIDTHVGEITRAGFRMFHRVMKGGNLVALMEAGFVTYNYNLERVVPVPREFLEALSSRRR